MQSLDSCYKARPDPGGLTLVVLVVVVAHSWFNRFRKLLVRYEKPERSFIGLNHLAAAVIAFRKVPLKVNTVYG